jgi:hypothetical protein
MGEKYDTLSRKTRFPSTTVDDCPSHKVLASPGLSLRFAGSYRGADKSLARPTSRCILFDGLNISFDASHVVYINSINIPPIVIINRIYETQNLLSL